MDIQTILKRKAEIERDYGPWVAHNIRLTEHISTFPIGALPDKTGAQRFLQIVSDHFGGALQDLRILDLGCLEGAYSIEFALHGADVVGIEGRRSSVIKAEFTKEVLGLQRVTFIQDDVRNLSVEKYGRFDVVLCCGLLYHLDAPDVFAFVEKMAAVCNRLLLLDTHVSLRPVEQFTYKGHTYHGWRYREFSADASDAQKLAASEASLDNNYSFWPTRPSLWNVLAQVGFSSVARSVSPALSCGHLDRDTIVAIKGPPTECRAVIELARPGLAWPEIETRKAQFSQAEAMGTRSPAE